MCHFCRLPSVRCPEPRSGCPSAGPQRSRKRTISERKRIIRSPKHRTQARGGSAVVRTRTCSREATWRGSCENGVLGVENSRFPRPNRGKRNFAPLKALRNSERYERRKRLLRSAAHERSRPPVRRAGTCRETSKCRAQCWRTAPSPCRLPPDIRRSQTTLRRHASSSQAGRSGTPSSEMSQEIASSGTVSRMAAAPFLPLPALPALVNRRLRQLDDEPQPDFGPVPTGEHPERFRQTRFVDARFGQARWRRSSRLARCVGRPADLEQEFPCRARPEETADSSAVSDSWLPLQAGGPHVSAASVDMRDMGFSISSDPKSIESLAEVSQIDIDQCHSCNLGHNRGR